MKAVIKCVAGVQQQICRPEYKPAAVINIMSVKTNKHKLMCKYLFYTQQEIIVFVSTFLLLKIDLFFHSTVIFSGFHSSHFIFF